MSVRLSHRSYSEKICFKVSKQGHVIEPEVYNKDCMLTYPSSKNPNVIQTGMWRMLKGTGSRSSGECWWCNKSNTSHSHVWKSHISKNWEESCIQCATQYFWQTLRCLEIWWNTVTSFTDWTGHPVLQIHVAVNSRMCNEVWNQYSRECQI